MAGILSYTRVSFNDTIPATLSLYEEAEISATYYENDEATEEEVTWVLSGASKQAYRAAISGNTIRIKCFDGSKTPLTIQAVHGNYSDTAQITLQGI